LNGGEKHGKVKMMSNAEGIKIPLNNVKVEQVNEN